MGRAPGRASLGGPTAGMHAFLFADLRGYTRFATTHGDRAAAELLRRYRDLVRDAVARHDGAEVRTEGDSFYVVFPTISAAVHCALAIAEAARTSSAADPSLPIEVGIGVHFGETVDTAEGSVGSAVNLAARLASTAGANEVLVSEVVRSLTLAVPDVVTTRVGPRRLKGFAEPVLLYRATMADDKAPGHRERTGPVRLALLASGIVAVALIAVAIVLASSHGPAVAATSPTPSAASPTATPSPAELAFKWGQLQPGRYVDRQFAPNLSLEVDQGWCGGWATEMWWLEPGPDTFYMYSPGTPSPGMYYAGQTSDLCEAWQRADDAGFIDLHLVDLVYGPSACDDGKTMSVGGSENALVDYLTTIPGTTISNRTSATLGGAIGTDFDVRVGDVRSCVESGAPLPALMVFPMTFMDSNSSPPRRKVQPRWWGTGQQLHVWVVELNGHLVVAELGHEGTGPVGTLGVSTPSTAFTTKAYPVIRSLRFLTGS